jgi:hypothetical protein
MLSKKMNCKHILLLVLLLFASFSAMAQSEEVEEPEKGAWRERVFFGGGGGLQFSNIAAFVSVMPSVGYRITPKLSAGITGIYQYTYFRDVRLSAHNYGASFFSRYFVLPQIYATAEYEQVNFDVISYDLSRSRRWVDRMLVGGGYFMQGGGRGGFHIGVLYDLFYTSQHRDPTYPYQSPFVYRVGFIF